MPSADGGVDSTNGAVTDELDPGFEPDAAGEPDEADEADEAE